MLFRLIIFNHTILSMKFQCSWRTDFICCPLHASFFLWRGSVYILQSVKTIFLPILVISVSISTSSPIFITFKNSLVSEIDIVLMWVILKMPIVVMTSIIVARAPPWMVYWMFFWWDSNLYLNDDSFGLSSYRSKATNLLPKSSPKPPLRWGLAQYSFKTSLAVRIGFIIFVSYVSKR